MNIKTNKEYIPIKAMHVTSEGKLFTTVKGACLILESYGCADIIGIRYLLSYWTELHRKKPLTIYSLFDCKKTFLDIKEIIEVIEDKLKYFKKKKDVAKRKKYTNYGRFSIAIEKHKKILGIFKEYLKQNGG